MAKISSMFLTYSLKGKDMVGDNREKEGKVDHEYRWRLYVHGAAKWS